MPSFSRRRPLELHTQADVVTQKGTQEGKRLKIEY